ncbi:MAG TPA: sugar phosphate isomerase/epimerase [Verrucomicrobiota bacterium]|nr:xylose isomerase [Verrucomicrobiales bacterium]HRI14361.1 sugar phosphate isomerase/epimerase [Verrucomicrobiota bacterium]
MRFGINTFLFSCPFTDASTRLFRKFKQWGFDSVEISVENLAHVNPERLKARLDQHQLVCGSVTPCLGPDKDLRGTQRQQRAGVEFMKRVVDLMVRIECPSLIGVVYSTVGRTEAVPPAEKRRQWKTVMRNLRELCGYAEDRGRVVALEPINRFETDFINTCEQGLQMIHDVGSPALKLHLDTFHMNIEEKDPAAAIRRAGSSLGHFHACGCDRGTPGNDHIDWMSIAAALRAIRYDGDVVIESFTADVKAIARAAAIWRRIEPTRDEIAWKGLKFLRSVLSPP